MVTKHEIHDIGYQRGWNVASWVDLPEIGHEIPKHVDWAGHRVIDAENQQDVWEMYCYEAESNSRQFSPFEFTANDLNELAETKPYDPWQVFEDAISAGVRAYWRQHHAPKRRRKTVASENATAPSG